MEEKLLVLEALEALKKASKEVEDNADDSTAGCNSPSMKALLHLETGSDDLFSGDPMLSTLSSLLSQLKSLASSLSHSPSGKSFRPIFLRPKPEISVVAGSIGAEIQSWIDRESIDRLVSTSSPDEKSALLVALESRLSRGYDRNLQDIILRSGAFSAVESALADPKASKRVRELSAMAVLALVRFNKSVFVGEVLMGPAVRSIVSVASATCLRALNGLISAIRSPIIDDLQANGEIPTIISLLSSKDTEIRVLALDSVLEIGYLGRKEAVDAMMEEGLIEKLAELQRSDLGGALIEMDGWDEEGGGTIGAKVTGVITWMWRRWKKKKNGLLESRPFASCVSRFAVQMEVGEGLRQRERRALKLEVVRRAREAAVSESEAGTLLTEVLWGSTYW